MVPSEDKAPLALEGWGLASYSDEDEEDEAVKAKPAAPKKGKSTGKPRDKYLLKKPAAQQDKKAKPEPEPEDQMMLGPAAGLGELLSSFDPFADAERTDEEDAPAAPRGGVVHLRVQQRSGKKHGAGA